MGMTDTRFPAKKKELRLALGSQVSSIFKVSYLRRDSKVSQLVTLSVAASILKEARLSTPKMGSFLVSYWIL